MNWSCYGIWEAWRVMIHGGLQSIGQGLTTGTGTDIDIFFL